MRGIDDRAQMLGVGGMHSIGDGLRLGAYDSQRSAQLVRDVG